MSSVKIYQSGFVALVGRPNVGKSTLLNAMVGKKLAIVSPRPQTTRQKIRGIWTTERGQVIFIDTPGIHKPKHRLGQYMVGLANSTLQEVDVVLFVIDGSDPFRPGDAMVSERLQHVTTPVFLVVNKVDAIPKQNVLRVIDHYRQQRSFTEVVPVSARTGDQVESLKELLLDCMPEGPQYYPEDELTDQPEKFIIEEIIREKVLQLTRDEIPHSVMVEVENMDLRQDNHVLYLRAIIYAERESQKGIIIGKSGAMLKQVGQLARRELEGLLGSKVFLELWVKVKNDWRNESVWLKRFGFDEEL
ncbi:GTPase Era [Alicyclobacillaceae bacterium I2511]|nr:GTPase Era [Alicyclobacillaceae bacterium I2511]